MKGIKAAAAAASRRTDASEARGTPNPSTSTPRPNKTTARNLDDLEDPAEDEGPRITGLDEYQQTIYNRRIKDPRIANQKLFLDTYGIQAIEK